MPMQSEIVRGAGSRLASLSDGDLRRFRRLPVEISGRFMRADQKEFPCSMYDVSVACASIATGAKVQLGERIVAYFDNLGGLEGSVGRVLDDGFVFQFRTSEHKREKLAAQIMWLVNRDTFPDDLGRAHERVGTLGRKTTLKFAEGVTVDVELLDLSASGASIGTSARPQIGTEVLVGKIPAVIRRIHDIGLGVQFLKVLSDKALNAAFP